MIYTQGELSFLKKPQKHIYILPFAWLLSDTLHSSSNTSVGTYWDSVIVWSKTVAKFFVKDHPRQILNE